MPRGSMPGRPFTQPHGQQIVQPLVEAVGHRLRSRLATIRPTPFSRTALTSRSIQAGSSMAGDTSPRMTV